MVDVITVQAPAAAAAGRCRFAGLALGCLLCGSAALAATPPSGELAGAADAAPSLLHLALDLRLDWAARQLIGMATLRLRTPQPPAAATRVVWLQAHELLVDRVTDDQGQALAVTQQGPVAAGRLRVDLGRAVPPDTTLNLTVAYRSSHVQQADPNALWGSSGIGLRWFEPTAADPRKRRQVWASGELGAQAAWLPLTPAAAEGRERFASSVTITVERPLVAVASGRPAGVRSHVDGRRSYSYLSERPHGARELALVVGEFVEIPQRQSGVQLTSWSYPDEAAGTAASVERLPETLAWLQAYTGQPLPQRHHAQVFVQDHPWGHAAQGLAVQSENMVDDVGVHADFQYLWDLLQAETLAAQWFGGLVGACDARHAWLERGLSRYAAAMSMEAAHGSEELRLYALASDQAAALGETLPLVPRALDDPRAFAGGAIPTSRGAAVLHLLRWEIGDEAFRRVLQRYLHENAGTVVCSEALRQAAEAEAGRDLGWFFAQWVYGAGQPSFDVETNWDASTKALTVVVRQAPPAAPAGWFQGHIGVEIDGRAQRLWLAPQAENRWTFAQDGAPRWVQLDPAGLWLKELRHPQPLAARLAQLRDTPEGMSRGVAGQELAALWKQPGTGPADRAATVEALREVAAAPGRWWRERYIALNLLRSLLAPAAPGGASVLDAQLRETLLAIVQDSAESAWLRATALRLLGDSRDARDADLFIAHLGDASDRVINAAAIALGRSGDARAFEVLAALPAHPSWKHQSLISALAGLKELGDPRGGDIALAALADTRSARWVLATPVWDYPLAAAQTLAALGQGARGVPLLQARLEAALAGGRDTGDIFYTAMLLSALGDAGALPLLAALKQRFADDAATLQAISGWEQPLQATLAAAR